MARTPAASLLWLCVCLSPPAFAAASQDAAPPPPEIPQQTILYGAAYYHEYMPSDRLEKDIELMKHAGLTVVRVGESTWTSWEPRDGEFQFAWMERILDALHAAGIKVILGTPTYSIPPWLYHKHPEVMVVPLGQVRGAWQFYGPRQNMDITHPVYLFHAERVIRQIVAHFKDHPAVIGYQLDNETSAYGTAGRSVQMGFVEYLKKHFGSVSRLNELWGLVYWGQLLNEWDEFPPRDGILNPGYKLEWERYQRKLVTDFLAWQARIVSEYKRPDQFLTHDFHGGLHLDVDAPAIARSLDFVAVNPYHDVQDRLDGWWPAFMGDYARSLKRTNYLVTETNAQSTGWDSKGQFPPYDGQLRQNVYAHVASGANMVSYWHWHSLHYGQETYWKGLLGHDLAPNRVYGEFAWVAGELKNLGPRLVNLKKDPQVAILHSMDSHQGIRFMPFHDSVDYAAVERQMHQALYRLNVDVDFVFPENADLARYKVLVVPPLYVASDETLEKIKTFVRGGGHALVGFKSGFCNEYSTVRSTRQPGLLREAAGVSYQEFSTLREPLKLKGDPFRLGPENKVSVWAEMLESEGAQVLASYDHPFFGRWAAITRNTFGDGTLTYVGTHLSDALMEKLMLNVLRLASLEGPEQALPRVVRVRQGATASGTRVRFFFNYSAQPQKFAYAFPDGEDLVTKRAVRNMLTLAPWGVAIVAER
jgi:beta-galactosidase